MIPSVTFIVAAKIDSKKETTGRFISPTLARAIANTIIKIIIGIISPLASASIGFAGIKLINNSDKWPFWSAIAWLTICCVSTADFWLIKD